MGKGSWNWSKEEVVLLRKLWPDTLTSEISKIIDHTEKSIMNKAGSLGLQRDESKIVAGKIRKTIVDLSEIDTEEKAYLLGFSAADGSLVEKKGHSPVFGIKLHSRDAGHIYKLRDLVCPEAVIYETERDNCIGFRIGDPILSGQLQRHGIIFRKTYDPQLPKTVPRNVLRHWIRGYFDGDGCITHDRERLVCNFTAYSLTNKNPLFDFIHKEFTSHNGCRCPMKVHLSGEKTAKLTYYGQKGVCLLNYLYKDCTIHLDRKYKLAKSFLGRPKQCKNYKKKFWSEEDVVFLSENWKTLTHDQMSSAIGHSVGAVRSKAKTLGLEAKKIREGFTGVEPKAWTSDDKEFIAENYLSMRYKDIALYLGRSLDSIRSEIGRLQRNGKLPIRKNTRSSGESST